MPHKVAILSHLDHLTPAAKAIGAVNTIWRQDGALWGTNTDCIGIREAVLRNATASAVEGMKGGVGMVFVLPFLYTCFVEILYFVKGRANVKIESAVAVRLALLYTR